MSPPRRRRYRSRRRAGRPALLFILAGILMGCLGCPPPSGGDGGDGGEAAVRKAFQSRADEVPMEVEGEIIRVLSDDLEGSRHQRFIVELDGGHTLLISHNIDLAPRVPLQAGERVAVNGLYAWNPRGGVIHWTHHDPQGRHAGGWIRHRGQLYR